MQIRTRNLDLVREAQRIVSSLCSPSEGYRVLFATRDHTALRHANGNRIDVDVSEHAVSVKRNGILKKLVTDETALR